MMTYVCRLAMLVFLPLSQAFSSLHTTATARTNVRMNGLQLLPRSRLGACTEGAVGATPVLFGEDLAVSCTMSYTPAALEAACTAQTAIADQPLLKALNVSAATLVGRYGDAHPSTATDWAALTLRYPQNTAAQLVPSWTAATKTCSNLLSGFHLRVLYTEVGPTAAPINKVVGAELVYTSRNVQATRCVSGPCATTQVAITATATFAKLSSEAYAFIPDAPQLIPPLPYDFFYPFGMSTAR